MTIYYFVYLIAHLDRAYIEACREGTKKVYNARMILAGYSEAGKTSLAIKLSGGKINVDEKKSTEGISLRRIESTFNNKGKQKTGGKWTENYFNTSDLSRVFSDAVWSRAEKMGGEGSSRKSSTDEKLEKSSNTSYLNSILSYAVWPLWKKWGSESSSRKSNNNDKLEKYNDHHSEIKFKSTEESPLSDETRAESIRNKNVVVNPELEVQTPFTLSVWDLGGQDEFISTHHLFLSTEATLLIVMDITKGLHQLIGGNFELGYLNSPAEVLHYWLNLFHSDAANHNRTPNIAIVLTHTDKVKGNKKVYIDDYKKEIMEMIKGKPYDDYIDMTKIYAVSNATGTDSDFDDLRDKLLQHLIQQRTWGYNMPINWLKLKHDIITRADGKGAHYLYLNEIWELGEKVMMGTNDIESFLERQTTLGDFLCFPGLRDLVITEPAWLIQKCRDLISTHKFIDQRKELSKIIRESLKKGHITENGLKQLWQNDGVIFLIKLMEKFDLLIDVSDHLERKYIIPCMLGSKFYKDVPYKALIRSFPQFVSKCSKEKNWKLDGNQDHLSYTNATFDIGDNVKLSLSLSQLVQVQTNFLWPKNMDGYDRDKIQRETKASLARLLKTCQIQTADDEGSVPFEFFAVCTNVTDLTFLPMLYIWTDASKLSYVKMLSYADDLIPDICGQHLNNLELHKECISICTNCMRIFLTNTNILSPHNIYTKAKMYIHNIDRDVKSVTFA